MAAWQEGSDALRHSSRWKPTFSPIADPGLAKAADCPLRASSALGQSSLFAFQPTLQGELSSVDATLATHPRKGFPGALSGLAG